jgi:hypothetical protein
MRAWRHSFTVMPVSLSPSLPFSDSRQAGWGMIKNIRTICAEQHLFEYFTFTAAVGVPVFVFVTMYLRLLLLQVMFVFLRLCLPHVFESFTLTGVCVIVQLSITIY